MSADFGLSVTGIANNRGSSKPVGHWFTSGLPMRLYQSWPQYFMINRADSCERAAVGALFRLRERLIENNIIDYVN